MWPRDLVCLIRDAASEWSRDNAQRLSAALAYYSIFSLAPLLVIVVSAAGLIFGDAAARGQVEQQMKQLAGERAAAALQAIVLGASDKSASLSATLVGLVVLFFGASSVFMELKDALNTIWGVQIKPGRAIFTMIRERVFSLALVLGVGFLLVASLIVSAALAAIETYFRKSFSIPAHVLQGADFAVSIVVVSILFALIFKIVPNVVLAWRDVWGGALATALFFTIGKFVIGFYLGRTSVASYYGAAGSAVIILLWVYYSACILFLGAELTKVSIRRRGRGIIPDSRAIFRSGPPGDTRNQAG